MQEPIRSGPSRAEPGEPIRSGPSRSESVPPGTELRTEPARAGPDWAEPNRPGQNRADLGELIRAELSQADANHAEYSHRAKLVWAKLSHRGLRWDAPGRVPRHGCVLRSVWNCWRGCLLMGPALPTQRVLTSDHSCVCDCHSEGRTEHHRLAQANSLVRFHPVVARVVII